MRPKYGERAAAEKRGAENPEEKLRCGELQFLDGMELKLREAEEKPPPKECPEKELPPKECPPPAWPPPPPRCAKRPGAASNMAMMSISEAGTAGRIQKVYS
jgi:hypothetical protein